MLQFYERNCFGENRVFQQFLELILPSESLWQLTVINEQNIVSGLSNYQVLSVSTAAGHCPAVIFSFINSLYSRADCLKQRTLETWSSKVKWCWHTATWCPHTAASSQDHRRNAFKCLQRPDIGAVSSNLSVSGCWKIIRLCWKTAKSITDWAIYQHENINTKLCRELGHKISS